MTKETRKENFAKNKCKLIDKTDGNNVNGKAVVATQDLKRGEVVCYLCGTIFSEEDSYTPRSGKIHENKVEEAFFFEYDEDAGLSVDPGYIHDPKTGKATKHISGFINHSCNPNCYCDENNAIVTKKPIQEGKEITIFYSKTWFEERGIFCQCGEDKCTLCKEKALNSKATKNAKEGEKIEREINVYKRNRELRDHVAQKSNYRCQVCGKKLTETYGEFGANLIHVHHQIPLASRKGRPTKTKVEDLIAVCPNCHAVLHNMEKYPTVNTTKRLKKTIKRRQEEKEE